MVVLHHRRFSDLIVLHCFLTLSIESRSRSSNCAGR